MKLKRSRPCKASWETRQAGFRSLVCEMGSRWKVDGKGIR